MGSETLNTGQNFQIFYLSGLSYTQMHWNLAQLLCSQIFHAKIYDFSLSLVVVMLLKNATVAVLIAGATSVRRSRPRPC